MSTEIVGMGRFEDQQAKINAALNRRGEADYQCYMLMRQALNWIGVKPYSVEAEDVRDLTKRIQEVLDEREDANYEFCRAVINREARAG